MSDWEVVKTVLLVTALVGLCRACVTIGALKEKLRWHREILATNRRIERLMKEDSGDEFPRSLEVR